MPFQQRKPVYSTFLSAKFWIRSISFLCIGVFTCWAIAQFSGEHGLSAFAMQGGNSSPDGIWTTTPPSANDSLANKPINVSAGRRFHSVRLQRNALLQQLAQAPLENSKGARAIVTLPMPDGSFERFAIEDSPNMEPALAAKFPQIKSYRATSLDHPEMIGRLAWSPRGLRAFIAASGKSYSLEPLSDTQYVSYDSGDAVAPEKYECLTEQVHELSPERATTQQRDLNVANVGPTRRNYRLAVATTYEYTVNPTLGGGNKITSIASVNEWINAVNVIYERDLAAHFNLVANNDQLIYDTSSDPFTNGNASAMLAEIRAHLNTVIGPANYDVGHVLGVGASGVAYVGVACIYDDYKGGGVSNIPASVSVGHPFYIGRIAHEIGHMFSAPHSFNDNTGNCGAQRSTTGSYESGSGYTIMAYAGSCNAISLNRAIHFHSGTINQIADFMQNQATCATTASTGNQPPTVNAGADRTIPKLTPFALTASANDPDSGDNSRLTYSWEQYDAGGTSFGNPAFTDDGDPSTTTRPIFRPFAPVSSPTRLFPELFFIQDYNNEPPLQDADLLYVAQHLPRVTRNLNFKVLVRDQRGGVGDDNILLSVDGNSGPFAVTSPDTAVSWAGGSQQVVTWSVNNTNVAPVNCANVKISLSIDNGETFPFVLLSSTPNDGRETVTMPSGQSTSLARVKVEAVNNVFFDMSDASFALTPGTAVCPTLTGMTPTSGVAGSIVTLTGDNFTGVEGVKFSNNVNASFSLVSNTQLNVTVPAGIVAGPLTIIKSGCANLQTPTFTPTACGFTLSSQSTSVGAGIQTASVNVTTSNGCAWTASSNANWITIASGTSGNGNGTVNLSIAANTGAGRTGTVTVAGQTFTVTQAGGCTITLSASSASPAATASTGSFNVTAGAGCAWTAVSNQTWLTITSGASGNGNGTVNYSVVANTGASRTAVVTVADKTFTVTQAGNCTFTLSTSSANVAATASTGSFNVTAGAGCAWTAVSNQTWLTITSGASGNGNGTVNYSVAANTGASRNAVITAGGKTFTVTQASGCAITLSASSANVAATAGTGNFTVTAGTGCAWTAASNQTWLTITSGASGSSNGTVNFSFTANTSASRSAIVTVAGKTYTVTQAGGCTITLTTSSANAAATSSSALFYVNAGTGCAWTATSNANWITLVSGASGNGNGTVNYSVAANTGAARTGTITIADKTFTVSQASGCNITLSASSANVAATASTGSFNVTAGTGCTWTAASNQPWLTLTGGTSGSGNGAVNYSVAANTGVARTATITAGGKTFTVSQAGGCSYTIGTTSSTVGPNASTLTLNVTASAGCTWTAASNASWITIASGASGNGNGAVGISLAVNNGPQRTGTATIAGNTYTVTQNSGCAYVLSAASATVAASANTGSFNVTAGAGCTWTAVSNQTWLTITSGASGNGNGTVSYSFTANTGTARTATITAAGKTFTLTQNGGCVFALTSPGSTVTASASNVLAYVNTVAGCAWTATSNAAWLSIASGASGTGNGSVGINVAANSGGQQRAGTVTIAGLTYTVTQAAGCSYGATISGQTFSSQAGLGTVTVTATAGCAWAAASNQSWLTITTASTGAGNGMVGFSLAPNATGNLRQATLTVAGRSFVVSQDATCGVTLPITVANVSAVANTGVASVTTNPLGCVFNATSNAAWLTISAKSSSAVNYSVAANTGAARTGTLTIGDKTFTVNQAAAPANCTAYFTPDAHSASYAGGSYNVTVSTGLDCRWNATTQTPWIILDEATTSGVRRGTLNYMLATNTTSQARTGTIQVGQQAFTITQAAAPACTYSVSPMTMNAPANGGSANFTVNASASCSWSSASADAEAAVTAGGYGTGNGSVAVMTQPNVSGSSRTLRVFVAGQVINLTQAAGGTTNPLATVARTYPEAFAVGATRTLTVYGRNFLPGSVVRWNGADRVTTYVSDTQLNVTIPNTDLSADKIGTAKVSVFNPASTSGAGGGISNALDFRVVRSTGNVQAASYGLNGDGSVAPETIMAGFGANLAPQVVVANTLPLPTSLGGTSVRIYDSAGRSVLAPLFFVSQFQVNYLVPAGLAAGTAEVVITGTSGRMEVGTILIASVSPGLFTFNATGQGVVAGQALRVRNGVSTYESIAYFDSVTSKMLPTPIDLGPTTDQVYLVLYGTGFRNRTDLRNVQCFLGGQTAGTGTEVSVLYLGSQNGLAGLDQTNLLIPRSLIGSGTIKVWLKVDGKWANPVEVSIK